MGSWNLFKWLDAVGVERADQPDLIHGVQPVVVLGDHSAQTSPILPPTAWAGGSRGAIAGAYGCLEFTSRASGGSYLRQITGHCGVSNPWRMLINQSPGTLANVVTPAKQEMAPVSTVSQPRIGTLAAEPLGSPTCWFDNNTNLAPSVWTDAFFIAPGSTLQLWYGAANNAVSFAVLWEDCEAARGQS